MHKKWIIVILASSLFSCTSMVWHEGSVIQYKQLQLIEGDKYKIEVLGGWDHDKAALERAVLKKAKEECHGDAEIISSQMGTYLSASQYASGNAPKIVSVVQCLKSK